MPLRETSGPEVEKFLEAGRKADSSLLQALSEYFIGLAGVEALDIRKPSAKGLRSCAQHLASASKHLGASRKAGEQMLKAVPSDGAQVIRLRVNGMMANATNLDKVISKLTGSLKSGKYPSMANCIDALNALDAVMATFKVNANTHQGEGF